MSDLVGYVVSESVSTSTPQIVSASSNRTNNLLSEDVNFSSDRPIVFKAELQEADAPNRNGRIYGKSVLEEALNHYSVQEKLQHKSWYGKDLPFITVM